MEQPSQATFTTDAEIVGPSISSAGVAAPDTPKALGEKEKIRAQRQASLEDFEKFLKDILGDNFFMPEDKSASGAFLRRASAMLDNSSGLRHSDTVVAVDFDGGKKSIQASAKQVVFVSPAPKSDFTMDDAIRMAIIASQNKVLLTQGVKLEGTAKQQAMLQKAIESLNESLPPEARLNIKNPKSRIKMAFEQKADVGSFVSNHVLKDHTEEKPEAITKSAVPVAPKEKTARPEEQIILSALNDILKNQSESKLRNSSRLFEKDGASTGHNVYQIATPAKLPSGETANLTAFYIVKDGKPVIAALKKNDEVVLRHNDIYLKNDIHHPKHPSFGKTAEPESPIVTTSSYESITARATTATYGPDIAGQFAPAVDHHAAVTASSARAAAAVKAATSKGPAPIGPI